VLIDVRKKEAVLSATDLEVGIVLSVAADVKREGKITVPARKFLDIVRELPGDEVSLETDAASRMLLKAGAVEIKLLGLAPDEFPQLPEVKKEAEVKVACATLAKMIDRTLYAVSNDETRYVLNGAYLVWEKSELKMVTTDGRRLSFIRAALETGGKGEAVVPTKALQELVHLFGSAEGEVTVVLGEGYAKFTVGGATLTTRLIDGRFPDYEQVIPKAQDKKVTVKTDAFLAATRRAALIAADRSSSVRLDVRKGFITFSAASHELGEAREEVPAEYDGESVSVAYNARYLTDVLKHIETKETLLELSTALAPGVLRPAGDETYVCVVMPIRL
jgi:DNA polymerase-3 subunit beta